MSAPQRSSAENPWSVRVVSNKVAGWIERLGEVWVEGQITQLNKRPGTSVAFLTLRDPSADASIQVTCSPTLIDRAPITIAEGTQVVMRGKFSYFMGRGSISLRVNEIRPVGVGELLARIERLRSQLASEGLFDQRRKQKLPFLPRTVGLITGKASAAERDILEIARTRWPAVHFAVRHATVQGPTAVTQITTALGELDAIAAVEVIIVARGGGSVEDLLPFSDEALCRAISATHTPVVSAIGHEPDSPLCDLVADVRAATPTDAAKRVVPDVASELSMVRDLRGRSRAALRSWVSRESRGLRDLRSRPVLADPARIVATRVEEVAELRRSIRRDILRIVERRTAEATHLRAQLATLGPAATLARGYAVVQKVEGADRSVVRSVDDIPIGSQLRVRVGDGAVTAAVLGAPERTTQ